jgi:hypothetical protein
MLVNLHVYMIETETIVHDVRLLSHPLRIYVIRGPTPVYRLGSSFAKFIRRQWLFATHWTGVVDP